MADSALPEPQTDLEYKTTKGLGIGYTTATVPPAARTGTQLTEGERAEVDKVVGSPAQGNAVPNESLASVGALIDEVDSPSVLSSDGSASSQPPAAPTEGETVQPPAAPTEGETVQTADTEKQRTRRRN